MQVSSAISRCANVDGAVAELRASIADPNPAAVVYFASSAYDAEHLAAAMQRAFQGAEVFGCSSSGEIASGVMAKGSVVAMAWSAAPGLDLCVQVVTGLSSRSGVDEAFAAFSAHFGQEVSSLSHQKYVGLVLADGLSGAEERLLEWLGNRTDVIFVGGSAGDDLRFERTHVMAKGRAFTDAAVLVLVRPPVRFEVVKTQSFDVLDARFVVTRADQASRVIHELDHRPAARVYAEALGVEPEQLASLFMRHPLGLLSGSEPYVRSPQRLVGDSIAFYCNVVEGMELALLRSGDIVGDTEKALVEAGQRLGSIGGIINFHCILRTLELEAGKLTDEYGRIFSKVPTVGLSTYGEAYLGHVNQTSTMLVLGKE